MAKRAWEQKRKLHPTTKCSTYLLTTFFSCRRKVGTFPFFRSLLLVKYSTKEDVIMLHSIYNFGSGSISIILSSKNYLTFFNIHYLLQPFLSKCSMSLRHVTSFLIPLFKGFFLLVNEPEMYLLLPQEIGILMKLKESLLKAHSRREIMIGHADCVTISLF